MNRTTVFLTRWMKPAACAGALWLGSCAPLDGLVVETDGAAVSAALLDDDRYRLINAYDFFSLPADQFPCSQLMQANLVTGLDRNATSERSRVCPQQDASSVSKVLGKVSEGRRVLLVVASHVAGGCSTQARQEVDNPGQPLAVGCEEQDITGGANHRVHIKLFPHRDPQQ